MRIGCDIKGYRVLAVLLISIFCLFCSVYSDGAEPAYFYETSSRYTYQEMEQDLIRLSERYKDCMQVDSIGKTYDKRNLYHVLVGDSDAEAHILILASIHAREYITSQLVMRQLGDFLEQWADGQDYKGLDMKDLTKQTAVHVVPMVNPDGVTLCQLGLDGMECKETRQNLYRVYELDQGVELEDYFRQWKSNARGVDLNRNFDAKWTSYQDGVGHPSSDHYKGEYPGSEAETTALMQLTRSYPFRRTISYHAQGEVIYWFFEQEQELREINQAFAETVSEETGYRVDGDYEKLDPAGYKDWAVSRMKIPSITIEVGIGSTPVDPGQLPDIWEQNKTVIYEVLYQIVQQ